MARSSVVILFLTVVCISAHFRRVIGTQTHRVTTAPSSLGTTFPRTPRPTFATTPVRTTSSVVTSAFRSVHAGTQTSSYAQTTSSNGPLSVHNDVADFSSFSLSCRTVADVLERSNFSVYNGNRQCGEYASNCVSQQVVRCSQRQIADGSLSTTVRWCVSQGKTSALSLGACIMPTVVKNCFIFGCSSCPSSINADFDNACSSRGGQLCRQAALVFGQRIHSQSVCAPSECNTRLLATTLAKGYAVDTFRSLQYNSDLDRPEILDNEISCDGGDDNQSYTIRSSQAKHITLGTTISHPPHPTTAPFRTFQLSPRANTGTTSPFARTFSTLRFTTAFQSIYGGTRPPVYTGTASTGLFNMHNDVADFSSFSIACSSVADFLARSKFSVYNGDRRCGASASKCVNQQVVHCAETQLRDRSQSLLTAVRACHAQGKSSGLHFGACLLPTVLKSCSISGCSRCSSSINADFDNSCTSRGGHICRQTALVFGQRIHSQSVCAPSVCNTRLLAISLAKGYAVHTSRSVQYNSALDRPEILDNEISCHGGVGDQSYTIRSSEAGAKDAPFATTGAYPTANKSGSGSVQAASRLTLLAVFVSVVALLCLV